MSLRHTWVLTLHCERSLVGGGGQARHGAVTMLGTWAVVKEPEMDP